MSELLEQLTQDINAFLDTIYYGSLNELIVCFAIGGILASIAALYNKKGIGRLVRYLLQEKAYSIDTAKTLTDAGLQHNLMMHFALRKHGVLRRIIIVDQPQLSSRDEPKTKEKHQRKREKIKLAQCKLYIPQAQQRKASHQYADKGSGIGAVLLTIFICILLAVLCIVFIPDIIQLMKNATNVFF